MRYKTGLCELEILDDGRLVVAGQRDLLAGAGEPIGTGIVGVMRYAGVDRATAVAMASAQPARALGIEAVTLAVGDRADLVVFDLPLDAAGLPTALRGAANDRGRSRGIGPFRLTVRGAGQCARSTANRPVRKIPSNVPAPPIEAIGAPSSASRCRFIKSAPINVPRLPDT